ncbi:MAG: PD40 domain-containing protein [Deltaproteobacteria bacterium]|nr:PD40 domain-containing protein [Deltaproteobacteria bacterium]
MIERFLFSLLVLLLPAQIAIAADEGTLCFQRGDSVNVQDLKTGRIRRVATGTDPWLSPDGKQIVYTANLKGVQPDRVIKVVDLATGKSKEFKRLAGFIQSRGQWSPDGRRLALNVFPVNQPPTNQKNWKVILLDPDTGECRRLMDRGKASDEFLSSWRVDGQAVLTQDMNKLFENDLNGNILRTFEVESFMLNSASHFLLSPDGSTLVFDQMAVSDTTKGEPPIAIFAYDLQQKKLTRLTPKGLNAVSPNWWHPGREIIFHANNAKALDTPFDLYRLSLADPKPILVLRNGSDGSVALYPKK